MFWLGWRKGMVRRSRALLASRRMWRMRLVFWCGALAIGLVATVFAYASDAAQHIFFRLTDPRTGLWWLPLLITPAGFVACAVIAERFFPGSQGSGIPQAMAARRLEGRARFTYLTMRIAVGKFFLTVMGLLCGASIGREGPTVQIGAALMMLSARLGGMSYARGLILAGSAAGIAAAFNTPLAGIVFAIEELGRAYSARTNGLVLSAVIIAGIASLALVGNYTYFGVSDAVAMFPSDWPLVILSGVCGGILGAAFSIATLSLTRSIRRWRSVPGRWKAAILAGTAGLVVAIVGVAAGGATFGTSYDIARGGVEGETLPALFFAAKFVATLASTVSGIPGGLFAPSLAVGSGLGSTIGAFLGSPPGLAAILGMAGYFAGVVQAPMTAFIIVLEMTGTQTNVIAIMTASMIGYGVSRLIAPEPLYHGLARLWLADALRGQRNQDKPDT